MVRIVVALVLLLTALPHGVYAQEGSSALPDLAAILLSPADPGLEEYLHAGAFDESLADEARIAAAYRSAPDDEEVYAALLQSAGFARKHISSLQRNNPRITAQVELIVRSYVTAFHSAEGASVAFAALEDEGAVSSAEDIEPSRLFGEETDLTLDGGFDAESRPFRSMDLTFRIGSLVGGVTVIAYPSETGFEPNQTEVEELGAILAGRMTNPPQPSLGASVARLDPAETITYDDAYYRRDGQDLPMLDESAEARAVRTGAYGDAETVYQLFQGVDGTGALGALYSVTLYEFASDEAAAGWMTGSQQLLMSNDYYSNAAPTDPGAVAAVDARGYTFGPFGAPSKARITLARSGEIVVRIQLVPNGALPEVPATIAAELTNTQLACIEHGGCISIAIPDALTSYLNTPPATPRATPVGSPAPAA